MQLTFTPTRPAVALWWAMFWRTLVWTLALIIPIMGVLFVIYFTYAMALLGFGVSKTAIASGGDILGIVVNNILLPIFMSGFVFWRILRKGGFSGYTMQASYKGQPVTTFKRSLLFAVMYYWEGVKYVWPLVLLGVLIGVASGLSRVTSLHVSFLSLLGLPLFFYLHLLVLSDLILRRTYGNSQLLLERKPTPPAQPKP